MDDEALWGPQPTVATSGNPDGPEPSGGGRAPLLLIALVVALAVALAMVGLFVLTRGGKGETEQVTSETTGGRRSPAAVLGAAPAATRAGGTARIRTSMRSFESGDAVKEVVSGIIGFDTGAYDLTYTFDAGPRFPGGMGSEGERVFSDGTTTWSAIPPYADLVPDLVPGSSASKAANPFKGKKYLAERIGQPGSGAEFDVFGPQALGFSIGTAPAAVLDYLTSVGTAVEEGKEPLDGEETTRYGVDLDLDALQRALPSEDRYFDAYDFKADVPHTFPAKVWLDGAGRLRKLTYRLDLAGLLTDVALKADYVVEECADPDPALVTKAEAGDRKAMAALATADHQCTERPPRPEELVIEGSVEISSFGTPLAVAAPPAAEVVTSDELDAYIATQAGEAFASGAAGTVPGP